MKNEKKHFQILDEIYFIINSRSKTKKKNSYTSKLFKEGNKKIAEKVLEECSELIIDFLKGSKKRTIEEASDLLFHIIVLLKAKKIKPDEIEKELKKRMKKKWNTMNQIFLIKF